MRRAAKRDGNEAGLAKIPPLYGWTIRKLSDTGKPDWICMRHGRVVFIEIKDEGGTLTPAQEKEFPLFEAAGCPVHVCRTELDVRKALGLPVEGILGPVESIRRLYDHVARVGTDSGPLLVPVHPNSIAGKALRAEVKRKGHVDVEEGQIVGHAVTPAYQRAQTAAVVPTARLSETERQVRHPRKKR